MHFPFGDPLINFRRWVPEFSSHTSRDHNVLKSVASMLLSNVLYFKRDLCACVACVGGGGGVVVVRGT